MTPMDNFEKFLRRVGRFSPEQARALNKAWSKPGVITSHVRFGPLQISKLSTWTDIACDLDVPAAVGEYNALLRRLKQP